MSLFFIDCEADGPCPGLGELTEFGAVEFETRQFFHGKIWNTVPSDENPAIPRRTTLCMPSSVVFEAFAVWIERHAVQRRATMVSDNPAYDWQWINFGLWHHAGRNPLGFSARRIGDFYAGLRNDFFTKQNWKKLRDIKHDHNPVNDALGNCEAFQKLLRGQLQ